MKTKRCMKLRTVMGQALLVDESMMRKGFDRIVALNKSAAMLWARFQGRRFQCSDMANALVARYGIDSSRAMTDATALADKLIANGLVSP